MSRNSRAKRRIRNQGPGGPPRPQPHLLRTDGATALAERAARPAYSALTAKDLDPAQMGSASWQGWATGTSGKPIPDMPSEPRLKPETEMFGASGTANFSGIITSDEYNPDLLSPIDRTAVYDQMRRNHGPIKAMLKALKQPILRADWKIEVGTGDDAGEEIASFVDTCLFHEMHYETTEGATYRQQWTDILSHALLMYDFGFVSFELCYVVEDGWTKWSKWTPLLPRTHWRWWVGKDNELAGLQQWTFRNWNYEFVNIPAWKLLPIAYDQEGNNYEGISLLRAAYKHFIYAQNFEKIDAIAIERSAVVPPVISLPENYTPADMKAAQTIVQNIRANEYLGVSIPNTWGFEYPRNQSKYAAQTLPAIQYHNTMILTAALCDWMGLGHTDTGSYSLAEVKVKMLEQVLQADMKLIEQRVNTAIRRLVDYNFEDVEVYPTVKAAKISIGDVTMMGQTLQQLGQGGFIHPTPELEEALLDGMGLPKGTPTVVTGTNPTNPNTPPQPENPQTAGQTEEGAMTPADQRQQQAAGGGPQGGSGGGGQAAGGALSESALLTEVMGAIRGVDVVERGERFRFNVPDPSDHGHWMKGHGGGGSTSGEGEGGGGGRGASSGAKSSGRSRGGAGSGKSSTGGARTARAPKSEEEQHAGKVAKAQEAVRKAQARVDQNKQDHAAYQRTKEAGIRGENQTAWRAIGDNYASIVGEGVAAERGLKTAQTRLANLQAARAKGTAEASGTAGARGKAKINDEQFHTALIAAHQNHADGMGMSAIRATRAEVMKTTGMSRTEFDQRLNTLRAASERGEGTLRAHYEVEEEIGSTRMAKSGVTYRGHDFHYLELGRADASHPVGSRPFTGHADSYGEATGKGMHGPRSGAGGGKAAAALKESIHERSARLQQEQALPREAKPGEKLTATGQGHFSAHSGTSKPIEASAYLGVYGEHQLGAALSPLSISELRGMATRAGVPKPWGNTRAAIVSAITSHVTQGRYSANFPKAAAGGAAKASGGGGGAKKGSYLDPGHLPATRAEVNRGHLQWNRLKDQYNTDSAGPKGALRNMAKDDPRYKATARLAKAYDEAAAVSVHNELLIRALGRPGAKEQYIANQQRHLELKTEIKSAQAELKAVGSRGAAAKASGGSRASKAAKGEGKATAAKAAGARSRWNAAPSTYGRGAAVRASMRGASSGGYLHVERVDGGKGYHIVRTDARGANLFERHGGSLKDANDYAKSIGITGKLTTAHFKTGGGA